jgi:hypothetical protein
VNNFWIGPLLRKGTLMKQTTSKAQSTLLAIPFKHNPFNSDEVLVQERCQFGCDLARNVPDLRMSNIFHLDSIPESLV